MDLTDPTIVAAVIGLIGLIAVAIIKYLLDRKTAREADIQQNKEAQEQKVTEIEEAEEQKVRDILSACNRGAIFYAMHEEQDTAAMLASLKSCRSTLQSKVASLRSRDQQEIVKEIIREIHGIE
jgi:hypothetical protein